MFVNNDIFVFCLSRSSIWAAANTLCRKSWYLCLRIRIHISAKKEMTSIVLIQYTQTFIVLFVFLRHKAIFSFFKGGGQEWWVVRELTILKDGRHCLHARQGGRDLARQMIMPSLQTALRPSPFLLLTCVLCIFADCTHRKERFSEICFTFADPLPPSHSLPNLTYFQALHPSSVWFKEMFLM